MECVRGAYCKRIQYTKSIELWKKKSQYSQGQSNATRVQDHSNRCFSLQANFLQANAVQRIIRNPACPAVHLVDPRCLTPAAPRPQVATGAPPPIRAPPYQGTPSNSGTLTGGGSGRPRSHPGWASLAHGVTIQKSSPTEANAVAQSVAAASWGGKRHTGKGGEEKRGDARISGA